ncbi:hypothetical protein JAAARDRAFT_189936 [Jaapia argillacea MUCL 33604]|uniref:Uncharacterized protein n=1 Tax=Jaapia argillacea MUCL 33604 TaxID=933084 RepID=A0A067QGJ7_9AGAM|nr:hypothetical protein JAAARDRAFT_189936 [Jaapia argillacea MUCL 33604]
MAPKSAQPDWRRRGATPTTPNRGAWPKKDMKYELIASPSRSSGMEKDGDALKDFRTQEEYRDFIQGKLDDYWKFYPKEGSYVDDKHNRRKELQSNISIQFRKLREGISSSKRSDAFAKEAYETSLYLSVLFDHPLQTTSTLSYLLPNLYFSPGTQMKSTDNRQSTTIISLLHHLVAAYPSQATFRQHLQSLPPSFLPDDSPASEWITLIASTLRLRNYAKFELLTRPAAFEAFLPPLPSPKSIKSPAAPSKATRTPDPSLASDAMHSLVEALRSKARGTTWLILRSAYRELSCQSGSPTRDWLVASLALCPVRSAGNSSFSLDEWLEKTEKEGGIKKKDGVEGRWMVCKVKS